AVVAVVVPVKQHGAQRGHQLVGDVAGTRMIVVILLRGQAAKHGNTGPHHVHRVGGRRQLFQGSHHRGGQAAQGFELGLVGGQFGHGGQVAVDQQVSDFLELAGGGDIQDVVATVVQIVAAATHGTQGGITGSGAAQGDGLLRLESRVVRFV